MVVSEPRILPTSGNLRLFLFTKNYFAAKHLWCYYFKKEEMNHQPKIKGQATRMRAVQCKF